VRLNLTGQGYRPDTPRIAKLGTQIPNNYSFFSVDRSTHFKIVAVALVCSVAVTLFCVGVRTNNSTNQKIASPTVIKAKTSIIVASDDAKAIR
jgi:hypothetical protein